MKKREKITLRSFALRDKDYPLWLSVFSGIFAVLNFRMMFGSSTAASPLSLVAGVIFTGFWLSMAFTAGIVRSKGFITTFAIIWGMALMYVLINLTYINNLPKGTELAGITSLLLLIMLAFAVATVLPLIPAVAYIFKSGAAISIESGGQEVGQGYSPSDFPLNAFGMLIVGLCAVVVIMLAYYLGMLYDKKDREKKKNKTA